MHYKYTIYSLNIDSGNFADKTCEVASGSATLNLGLFETVPQKR